MPAFERAFAEHDAEIAAIAAQADRADLRQHHRGAGARRPAARPGRRRVLRARRRRHQRRAAGDRARDRAAARRATGTASCTNDRLFRRIDALMRSARRARPRRRAGARAGALSHMFRRAGAALDAAARRRGSPRSPSGWRRSAPRSARTCSPTSRPTRWCSTARPISPACPTSCAQAARAAADERGLAGKHVITLSRSSVEPFLQFSARRDLREKAFRAWIARGDNGGATDNKAIIAEMVALRAERAQAARLRRASPHYRLDDAMAKTPAAVRDLLERVWAPARAARARRPRRHAGAGAGGGRQLQARAVGLALLRREAAQAPLRHRRERRSSRISSSTTSSRRRSTPPTGCSG